MNEPSELCLSTVFDGPYKIDLPESVLRSVVESSNALAEGPLIFEVRSATHALNVGVREFSVDEGTFALNAFAAEKLGLEPGEVAQITRVDLPRGTQITLTPELDSETIDWKSLLEAWIPQHYTALSLGDKIVIPYMDKDHALTVTHLEPGNASVCVIDTDMDLVIESLHAPGSVVQTASSEDSVPDSSEPVKLELDTTMSFGRETLVFAESVSAETIYVSCSRGLAYVGPEHATSRTSFIAVADSQPSPVSTALLGLRFEILAVGDLLVTTRRPEQSSDPVCEFCGQNIPQQSLVLHTNFCRRNSAECTECGRKFGATKVVPDAHKQLHALHSPASDTDCDCGEFSADTAASLAFHRATTCKLRLHICQFCHLLVPQGDTTPVDAALGLTGHESQCGNRTTDCPLCSRPVRLRSLGLHLQEHDNRRKQRQPPPMCANENCPNPLPEPTLTGLCAACFGPLSVPGKNNDMDRIFASMERRYILQMCEGCGKPWCQNAFCAMNNKRKISQARREAAEILDSNEGKHWFCVDEVRTRKAMFVQLEGEYARGWRGLAIQSCASESEAQQWLQVNANKLNE